MRLSLSGDGFATDTVRVQARCRKNHSYFARDIHRREERKNGYASPQIQEKREIWVGRKMLFRVTIHKSMVSVRKAGYTQNSILYLSCKVYILSFETLCLDMDDTQLESLLWALELNQTT